MTPRGEFTSSSPHIGALYFNTLDPTVVTHHRPYRPCPIDVCMNASLDAVPDRSPRRENSGLPHVSGGPYPCLVPAQSRL